VIPGVFHKSDVGGVRLHLSTPRQVELAAVEMEAMLASTSGAKPTGYIVQQMAAAGVEMLVGVVNDSRFGPTVACGAGGTMVELLKDVAVRLTPLTPGDATSMLRDLRSFPLLNGYRGADPADIRALEDVLLRVAALAEHHPRIAELDCNPVIVSRSGAVVVDARIRVQEVSPPQPLGARRC
jgi:acyl-CoA synthetase (NDP forming)